MVRWQDSSSFVLRGLILSEFTCLHVTLKDIETPSSPFLCNPQHLKSVSLSWPVTLSCGGLLTSSSFLYHLSSQLHCRHLRTGQIVTLGLFFFSSLHYIAGWYFVLFCLCTINAQCIFVYWLSKKGRKAIIKWDCNLLKSFHWLNETLEIT